MIAINTLISDNQIIIRSVKKDLALEAWGNANVELGMVWHKNYLALDPLVEDSFGAYFLIESTDVVNTDANAQRSALIPFEITEQDELCISTVSEAIFLYKKADVNLDEEKARGKYYPLNEGEIFSVGAGSYAIHFQVCIGKPEGVAADDDEIYYRFNFIKTDAFEFKVLLDDDYGWDTSTQLLVGKQ